MRHERTDWLVTWTVGAPEGPVALQAHLVGVFDNPMDANRLAGWLASFPNVRTLWVTRVESGGMKLTELCYENPRVDPLQWETENGRWETGMSHECEIVQWHRHYRQIFKAGVDLQKVEAASDERAVLSALRLAARTHGSSANRADAGPSPVLPIVLDESPTTQPNAGSASNAPTEP